MSTEITTKDWEFVISDAEAEIIAMRRRIAQLKASIRWCRRKMEAGEPLPKGLSKTQVTQSKTQTTESCLSV